MNNDKILYPSDDLTDNVHNTIDYHNVWQEQTNYNSRYTLANNQLQLNSNLEDTNETNDWKNTKSHEGELVIAYNINAENNKLRSRILYILSIGPNNDCNRHLIYKLSTDQILVAMKYQSVLIPRNLMDTMNKTDSLNIKIQINHFDSGQSMVWDNHYYNNDNGCQTLNNDMDNSEDGSHGELDNPQQLKNYKSNKIVHSTIYGIK